MSVSELRRQASITCSTWTLRIAESITKRKKKNGKRKQREFLREMSFRIYNDRQRLSSVKHVRRVSKSRFQVAQLDRIITSIKTTYNQRMLRENGENLRGTIFSSRNKAIRVENSIGEIDGKKDGH